MPRQEPDDPTDAARRALEAGDVVSARTLAESAAALRPDDPRAHRALARALYLDGDALRALRAARRAIELAPREPDAHALAGAAQLALGHVRLAIDTLGAALALDPSHLAARRHLAHALALDGRGVESLAVLAPLVEREDLAASDAADALELLDQLASHDPDPAIPRLARVLRARYPDARARTPAYAVSRAPARSVLDALGRDLTDLARRGKLDPVYGRGAELDAVMDVLLRRHKPNPLLSGPAGVGKTALLEALAQRIARGDVPARLRNRRVVEVSVAALVAGSSFRGELEARLRALLDEARGDPTLLLAIDEIHTLVGAGGMASELDASEILKPALARGELSVIGATTDADYERVIARDPTLSRRFTRIAVREPDAAVAIAIAQAVAHDLARFHGVRFDDDAASLAVSLAVAHIPSRCLPDKAIDVLDQSAVRAVRGERDRVTADDIRATVARLAQLPDAAVLDPVGALAGLAARLARDVVGQQAACDAIARALVLHAARQGSPRRPAALLLVGPAGTGKTLAARALSRALRGREDALERVDLADLAEAHDLARLTGAPAGYTGHDEPSRLVRTLRADPSTVLLFEGLDRAHDRVRAALAQWLENGAVVDARGDRTDLSHATVVFTLTHTHATRAGFAATSAPRDDLTLGALVRSDVLARIDAVIPFSVLPPDACTEISRRACARAQAEWSALGWSVSFDDAAIDWAVSKAERRGDGRAIEDALDRHVLAPVASRFAAGERALCVTAREGRLVLDVHMSEAGPAVRKSVTSP